MSKKQPTPEEHLDRLRTSVGKRVKYGSRTSKPFEHSGKIAQVYDGGRGAWITVQPALKDAKPVTVRPSQVKLF
jgi:hypothetical protein